MQQRGPPKKLGGMPLPTAATSSSSRSPPPLQQQQRHGSGANAQQGNTRGMPPSASSPSASPLPTRPQQQRQHHHQPVAFGHHGATYIQQQGIHVLLDKILERVLGGCATAVTTSTGVSTDGQWALPGDPIGAIIEAIRDEAEERGMGRLIESHSGPTTPTEKQPSSSSSRKYSGVQPPQKLPAEATEYIQRHRLAFLIEDWLQALSRHQPEEPLEYSVAFFAQLQQYNVQRAESVKAESSPLPPPPPPAELGTSGATLGSPATGARAGSPRFDANNDTNDNDAHNANTTLLPIPGVLPKYKRKIAPRILVLYYTMYRHCEALAFAAADGAKQISKDVVIKRIPETLPSEVVQKMQVSPPNPNVPLANPIELQDYDGLLFCFPTRFGSTPGQVQTFMDATGPLWAGGLMCGKVAAVMVTTATQHGGQETTIVNFHRMLMAHGMVVVGPTQSSLSSQNTQAVTGGSPYGASAAVGMAGERSVTDQEAAVARDLGSRVATIASKTAAELA